MRTKFVWGETSMPVGGRTDPREAFTGDVAAEYEEWLDDVDENETSK